MQDNRVSGTGTVVYTNSFLGTSCDPSRVCGSWGDVITIAAKIDCPTPARTSSWGAVKSMYR